MVSILAGVVLVYLGFVVLMALIGMAGGPVVKRPVTAEDRRVSRNTAIMFGVLFGVPLLLKLLGVL